MVGFANAYNSYVFAVFLLRYTTIWRKICEIIYNHIIEKDIFFLYIYFHIIPISNISNIMIHGDQRKLIKNLFIQYVQYIKIEKKNKLEKTIKTTTQ